MKCSTFNPAMLTVAREANRLSQGDLAKATGISQSKVSKYESGVLELSEEDLAAFVRVLDFPPAFFMQTDRVYGFGSACFYHRKRKSMQINELRAIQAVLNILRFNVTRLIRSVEIETDNKFFRMDVDEFGSPEEVARQIRHAWAIPLGPVEHLIEAIENSGGIVCKLPFGTRRLDAVSQIVPDGPPLFIVNADAPADRLRFTLAHELGHILMHRIPTPDMEGQADRFASEFLMPEAEIRTSLTKLSLHKLPDLKVHWKVSMSAIIKRAFDLGQITQRHYRTLFTQLSKHGWRLHEPITIELEEPTVLDGILSVHFSDLKYTLGDIFNVIHTSARWFRYLYHYDDSAQLRIVS